MGFAPSSLARDRMVRPGSPPRSAIAIAAVSTRSLLRRGRVEAAGLTGAVIGFPSGLHNAFRTVYVSFRTLYEHADTPTWRSRPRTPTETAPTWPHALHQPRIRRAR